MHKAIKTRQATDQHAHNPRQELTLYLSLPLEEADNIVAWWGVSNLIDLSICYCNCLLASLVAISPTITHHTRLFAYSRQCRSFRTGFFEQRDHIYCAAQWTHTIHVQLSAVVEGHIQEWPYFRTG
jgi:hypothetical protein